MKKYYIIKMILLSFSIILCSCLIAYSQEKDKKMTDEELAKINDKAREISRKHYQEMMDGKTPVPGGADDNWSEDDMYNMKGINKGAQEEDDVPPSSTFNNNIPIQLKKVEKVEKVEKANIMELVTKENTASLSGEEDLVSPKTVFEEKEEIEAEISRIDILSKENPDKFRPELAKLHNKLFSINTRIEMAGKIMDILVIGPDKSMGYIPGTATVWGVSTGLTSLALGNYNDGIIRLTGAIPFKNFGTVFSALWDTGIITPITNKRDTDNSTYKRPFQGVNQPIIEIYPSYNKK